MGSNTPKLALYKADPSENALVDLDINNNYDKIDAVLPTVVCTSSTRPVTPFTGMLIYEANTSAIRIWTGTTWKAQGTIVCTATTRPSDPSVGDMIYETDTDRLLIRTADNKWTTYLVTWRSTQFFDPDANIAQGGASASQGRILSLTKAVDGQTTYRFSAGWPGLKTLAGTAGADDGMVCEIDRGTSSTIDLTLQRLWTGHGCNPTTPQNGGTLSVDHTPPAGTWDFFLRMVEGSVSSIGTFQLYNSGSGRTFFTMQELPGAKY